MKSSEMLDLLEVCPIISAVHEDSFDEALQSPSEVVFLLESNIMTVAEKITVAHRSGKQIFIHLDLVKGIAKDRSGVEYLASLGVDGIISTKGGVIRSAKELGLLSVQRFFALDSQSVSNIKEMLSVAQPDFVEIMPGVIGKVIERFSTESVPVIAGGLIETKAEVTTALGSGAVAVSTGKKDLWYL